MSINETHFTIPGIAIKALLTKEAVRCVKILEPRFKRMYPILYAACAAFATIDITYGIGTIYQHLYWFVAFALLFTSSHEKFRFLGIFHTPISLSFIFSGCLGWSFVINSSHPDATTPIILWAWLYSTGLFVSVLMMNSIILPIALWVIFYAVAALFFVLLPLDTLNFWDSYLVLGNAFATIIIVGCLANRNLENLLDSQIRKINRELS